MGKTALKQSESKGSLIHKKMSEYAAHKGKAGHWVVRERSAISGRYVETIHQTVPSQRKVSAYTREEADGLNSLVDSAAKDAIDKG